MPPWRVWSGRANERAWAFLWRKLFRETALAADRLRRCAAAVCALRRGLLPREVRDKVWPFLGRGHQPLSHRTQLMHGRGYTSWPFVEWPVTEGPPPPVPEGFAAPYGPPPFLKPEW